MLIYDHNKQFLGLDNEDLQHLGFPSAAALFEQCSDFADLFVKRPGYIHNFTNFEWIDFVLHAEAEDSSAIIHTPKNNFTCKLVIKPFYLSSSPTEHGFMVLLQNLKPLSVEEDAKVAHDIEMHPTPKVSAPIVPSPKMPLPDVSLPNFDDMPSTELSEPDIFDIPVQENSFEAPPFEKNVESTPFKLDVEDIYTDTSVNIEEKFEAETVIPDIKPIPEEESLLDSFTLPVIDEQNPQESSFTSTASRSNLPDIPMLGDQLSQQEHSYIDNLHTNKNYTYDPHIAADELGLPVDLIEEFIGDFIQQSHDFHDELFEKVNAQDRDSIQTLSHKLKGVAANLRIEDAFEVLTIINTSHDFDEITANLKYYYHLIAKLEGDESAFLNLNTETEEETKSEQKPLVEEISETLNETLIPSNEESSKIEEDLIEPIEELNESQDEIPEVPRIETQEEDIYSFDTLKNDSDIFDIPQKPPTFNSFDDSDDEIYDFKAIEKPLKEDNSSEEVQKEEFLEIKQSPDEPLLIIESDTEEVEEVPEKRDFLEPVDTLEPQIEIADEASFNLEESDNTEVIKEEIAEKEPEIPKTQTIHSSSKAHNKRRKQKSKKGKPSFIQISKPELKFQAKPQPKLEPAPTAEIKPEPIIEVQKEVSTQTETIKKPSKPSAPKLELHFDSQEVSHELGLPHEFVKELIKDFKTDTLLHIDKVSNAISSFDTTTWQEVAKEYKGISDNLRLNEISTELQVLIKTNDAQKAKTALSRYRNYVNQL